jgi:hypothetical protein
MRIEKRKGHSVLYLSVGLQAIRIPENTDRKKVTAILSRISPGTPSRRNKSIEALNQAGIKAS